MSINLDVYVSQYKPIVTPLALWDQNKQATWPATSASLLTGAKEAVLIDALLTTAEAAQLVEWIRAKNKSLTTVYVTHGHGDHFLGLSTIIAAFPDAKAVTLPEVVPFTDQQVSEAALAQWGTLFPNQLSVHIPSRRKRCKARSLTLKGMNFVRLS